MTLKPLPIPLPINIKIMGEIRYFLNKSKGTKESRPIMLSYHFNGQRLFYYTGKKANEDMFDPDKKSPVTSGDERLNINSLLKTIRDTIGEIENKAKAGGDPVTANLIREGLNEKIKAKPQNKADIVTLTKYFDLYIAEIPNRINQRTGSPLTKASLEKYTTIKNLFNGFCKKEGREFDFCDIDSELYSKFTSYLIKDKNYSVNTYGRALKHFKTVLYAASNKGYNNSTVFVKTIQGVTEKADSIYLTESELLRIYELDLMAQPHLDRVRDIFLIGCWTGLRFSDFIHIKPDDVRDNRIRVLTQKTKKRVTIPAHPVVKSILEKYGYTLPQPVSKNNFNENIKTIASKADINENFVRRITKGGETLRISKEKFNFVSTHTARRSFATNMFLRGVPPSIIMGITGHATESEFFKYIKIDEEQKADMFEKYVNW